MDENRRIQQAARRSEFFHNLEETEGFLVAVDPTFQRRPSSRKMAAREAPEVDLAVSAKPPSEIWKNRWQSYWYFHARLSLLSAARHWLNFLVHQILLSRKIMCKILLVYYTAILKTWMVEAYIIQWVIEVFVLRKLDRMFVCESQFWGHSFKGIALGLSYLT